MRQARRAFISFALLLVMIVSPLAAFATTPTIHSEQARLQGLLGQLVYTADAEDINEDGVVDAADPDIMYSIEIGADPLDGRFYIGGSAGDSAAYPRLSQDGEIILCHAFIDSNGDGVIDHQTDMALLGVLNTDGTGLTPLTDPTAMVALEAEWAPDERSIIFVMADTDTDGDGALTINDTLHLAWKQLAAVETVTTAGDLVADTEVMVLTDDTLSVTHPQFWGETAVVFEATEVESGARGVYSYDFETEEVTLISPEGQDAWNPQISPDGAQVAMEVQTDEGTRVWVYMVDAMDWEDHSPADIVNASAPSWSPDGDWLAMAVSTDEGTQLVLTSQTGEEDMVLASNDGGITETQFSPGGDAVAFAAVVDEEHTALAVASIDGLVNETLTPEGDNLVDFTWNPSPPGAEAETSLPSAPAAAMFAAVMQAVADLPRV